MNTATIAAYIWRHADENHRKFLCILSGGDYKQAGHPWGALPPDLRTKIVATMREQMRMSAEPEAPTLSNPTAHGVAA